MDRRRFSDEIAEAVQLEIYRSGLREGDKLPSHAKLAEKLNVSIPSLREGLQTLAVLGVIHIAHGKGTIVKKPDSNDIGRLFSPLFRSIPHSKHDVVEVLRIILPKIVAEVRQDSRVLRELTEWARAIEGLGIGEIPSSCRTELKRFYRILVQGTQNRLLAEFIEALIALLFFDHTPCDLGEDDSISFKRAHIDAVEALTRNDAREAERLLLDFLAARRFSDESISVVFDTFGSGSIGGSFYSLACDVCRILQHEGGIVIEPEPTGGGVQNIELTEKGRFIIGLTQSDVAHAAFTGTGLFDTPHLGIRAICGAHILKLWILVRRDSGMTAIGDLRGTRIAMGAMGGESGIVAEAVLRGHGLKSGDYQPLFLSLSNAVNGLKRRKVDAVFFLASSPQTAIAELAFDIPVTLLPVSEDIGPEIVEGNEYWFLSEIPTESLPEQDDPVPTLGIPSLLITHADVPVDVVKRITRIIMEREDDSGQEPDVFTIGIESALHGVSIPLHPGAEEYYLEQGIDIPVSIQAAGDPENLQKVGAIHEFS